MVSFEWEKKRGWPRCGVELVCIVIIIIIGVVILVLMVCVVVGVGVLFIDLTRSFYYPCEQPYHSLCCL